MKKINSIKEILDLEKQPKQMKFFDVHISKLLPNLTNDQTLKMIKIIVNQYESQLSIANKSNKIFNDLYMGRNKKCVK